ncbi:MAG: DUF2892 domain-containing protein [Halobacteria archaeon]|nr:DUF2892 domain-containing protein [Halobacteria archaeon]
MDAHLGIEKNVGGIDRKIRGVLAVVSLVLGVATLAGYLELPVLVGVVALVAGAGLGFNAVTQRCLGNKLLGINTCSVEPEASND